MNAQRRTPVGRGQSAGSLGFPSAAPNEPEPQSEEENQPPEIPEISRRSLKKGQADRKKEEQKRRKPNEQQESDQSALPRIEPAIHRI